MIVIEDTSHTAEAAIDEIVALAVKEGFVTASVLARARGIPNVLATEQLTLAERAARLCRDDSIEGLKFYPNRFLM